MRSVLPVLAVIACGTPPIGPRPAAPDQNDPAYTVDVATWFLVGDAVTASQDTMTIAVVGHPGAEFIDAWVADLEPIRLVAQPDNTFRGELSIASLPIGSYQLVIAADGATSAFAQIDFYRSAPYYVLVSTDWDFSDPSDTAIRYQDSLHRDHPALRMTHFVGPYTFTDPQVVAARQQQIVDWLIAQRTMFDDEIGLHIHPYCNFVESAGLTCITDQSTVYPEDKTGYTIKCGAYDRTQFGTLLAHAGDLFEQHGLPRPRTFRAGGWTASADTLAALTDHGFIADTSALNWARIEEWNGKGTGELYRWNMENWQPIGDVSQPYLPNLTTPSSSAAPTLSLLEVPDNGVMIDYVTLDEMNGLFDANWNGSPLASPIVLMMGFHPSAGFSADEYLRVEGFLDYADKHLAQRGVGPVVYITLEDLVTAY